MCRFWYRRYFLDRFTRYFGNFFFMNLREEKRKTYQVFPRKASSKSTAKPRCCRSVVGNHRAVVPCEVCYWSVCVFGINALNLKHFYNVRRNFIRQRFLRFPHKNPLILANFFYRKRACSERSHYRVHNAKTFSQLKSKSRSLAKINESRLQPLLV